MTREHAVAELDKYKDDWRRAFIFWYSAYYVLGLITIILSTLIASRPKMLGITDDGYGLAAWALAVFTGLSTFLNSGDRGSRYRRAWSILFSQLTRYKGDASYTVNHVLEAYNQGEAIIHERPVDEEHPGSH
jgi:hypothetical protein